MIVTGWGDYDNRLQKAHVPVVSDAAAEAAYAVPGGSNFDPPIMVAAGNGSRDACNKDSGGPLFHKNEVGKFVQVRITNFGFGCGDPAYPGVYAEVNEPSISSFIRDAASR